MIDLIHWKKLAASLLAIFFVGGLVYASRGNVSQTSESTKAKLGENAQVRSAVLSRNLPPAPELRARSYIVRKADTREPLIEKNMSQPYPPASITKLMTVLAARELLNLEDPIVFSDNAKKVGEKQSQVRTGERLLFEDAAKAALMESANDAAYALAEAGGRNRGALPNEAQRAFVRYMNMIAARLALRESAFQNVTGLDEENHVMSARDIAKLLEYIWNARREIFSWSRIIETRVVSLEGSEYTLSNTDVLLREFPGLAGAKTGFTDKAGETLAFVYPARPNSVFFAVILGSEDRFGDGRKIIEWLEQLE